MNEVIFYILSIFLVGLSYQVAFNPYPVRSILSLIAAFVVTSILWLFLGAEFLALALVFVYVGAVMALFLYIVFMLNVDVLPKKVKPSMFYMGAIGVSILLGSLLWKGGQRMSLHTLQSAEPSNTAQIGLALYNEHWLAFELIGVVLLVAMICAVALVGSKRGDAKYQSIPEQIKRTVDDSITWMKK